MLKKLAGRYDASAIEVYSDVEGVRQNPNLYITTNDSYGMWVCLREIIDNARDEARAEGTTVYVMRYRDPLHFMVYDDGRGMPIDKHPKEKKPGIELIFCKLNAGAKMQHGGGKAYERATSGVHGMGACITNALSSKLVVNTYRSGKWHEFTCNNGIPQPVVQAKAFRSQVGKFGTEVNFTLNAKFFESGSKIETPTILEYLKLQSEFYPHIKFCFRDEANADNNTTFFNKLDLGKQLAARYAVAESDVFSYSKAGLHVALTFGDSEKGDYLTERMYACGMPTPEGGTHLNGLTSAVAACLPVKQKDLAPAVVSLLAGVLNIEVDKPKFNSQTKRKLRNTEVAEQVYTALEAPLRTFFRKHQAQFGTLVEHAKHVADMQKRHENETKLAKAVGGNGKGSLPLKLVRCPDCKPADRELFIVEGISALGTAKLARFPKYQEILPLTGKILNVVRNSEKSVNNKVIQDILKTIGYSKQTDDVKTLRVQKAINILTDSDADGGHITLLLLCLLNRYVPQAFKAGIVYVVDTPLYQYKGADEQAFADTLSELRSKVKHFDPACVSRMKGWGACSPKSLRKIAFGPERKLLRVKPLSKEEETTFFGLLGDDPELRRKMLNYTGDLKLPGKASTKATSKPASRAEKPRLNALLTRLKQAKHK